MPRRKLVTGCLLLALLGAVLLVALNNPDVQRFAREWQTRSMFVAVDADDFDPGPAIGSHFPGVHALIGDRPITLLQPLSGPAGLVLAVLQSPAESPFCRRQLQQLSRLQPRFAQAGLGLIALGQFTASQGDTLESIAPGLPLLRDQQTLSFRTLGLLDKQIPPNSSEYGRPYPGFIVINPQGIVVAKLFLADPHKRVDGEQALQIALRALEP